MNGYLYSVTSAIVASPTSFLKDVKIPCPGSKTYLIFRCRLNTIVLYKGRVLTTERRGLLFLHNIKNSLKTFLKVVRLWLSIVKRLSGNSEQGTPEKKAAAYVQRLGFLKNYPSG